jgi:hypothetical protein
MPFCKSKTHLPYILWTKLELTAAVCHGNSSCVVHVYLYIGLKWNTRHFKIKANMRIDSSAVPVQSLKISVYSTCTLMDRMTIKWENVGGMSYSRTAKGNMYLGTNVLYLYNIVISPSTQLADNIMHVYISTAWRMKSQNMLLWSSKKNYL